MYTAHLFQVTTGLIGPRLNYEDLNFSMELNGTESIEVKLKKSDLPQVDLKYWFAPWYAGVVVFWKGQPIVAGPIMSLPTESYTDIALTCGGIRSVLARRFVVQEQSDWSLLPKTVIQYSGMSLGTIAKRVVMASMQKYGGSLPISFPIPDQLAVDNADHQRTYQGFNIQNNNCDAVLTKLSNSLNGPDIVFKPRLVRDNQLTFDMWHGTEDQPRIWQPRTPVWDTTTQQGLVSNMRITTTGAYQTQRVFSIGAGMDQGQILRVATNIAPVQKGFPLLETSINRGNGENPNLVYSYAVSETISDAEVLKEIELSVRPDMGVNEIGSFWPGDQVEVVVKNWVNLADGPRRMRLLAISGSANMEVTLNMQEEATFLSHDVVE